MQSIDAVIFCGAGLLIFLVGSWTPDPRLDISGIPLGLILMLMASFLAIARSLNVEIITSTLILQAPLLLLATTLFWSADVRYGIEKISTLVISGTLSFFLFVMTIDRIGSKNFCRLVLAYLSVLLAVAVIFKLQAGFFQRDVSFFVSGPIVFARLMAVAALLAFASLSGLRRNVVCLVFLSAVFWTQSKGPMLALILTLSAFAFFSLSRRARFWLFLASLIVGAFTIIALRSVEIDAATVGRLGVFLRILTGDVGVFSESTNAGSLGVRLGMWYESLRLLQDFPLGTGLGGWASSVAFYGDRVYPHNLILELWTEGGLILGTLALIPFCIFLVVARKTVYYYVALFLLLAQLVSGDLADARFLLVFSFLAAFNVGTSRATLFSKVRKVSRD